MKRRKPTRLHKMTFDQRQTRPLSRKYLTYGWTNLVLTGWTIHAMGGKLWLNLATKSWRNWINLSLSQMPCLEQTSAIMILHLSLSSVIRSKAMLSLLFPVTKELKLSRNVILYLPLLLVPSILPVRDKNSSPLWRHMCPKNFSCLFLIVFMRDLSWFVSSNIDSFVLFSFHDILNILL